MKKSLKRQVMRVVFSLLLSVVLIAGCTSSGQTDTDNEMTSGWQLSFSFPHGVPALNQEAELLCTVDTVRSVNGVGLKVWVDLPDALQIVSGNLSWEGTIVANPGDTIPTVNAVVRSVREGSWQIRVHGDLTREHPGGTFLPAGLPVYVSISEDKAEWSLDPPRGSPLPTGEPFPSDYPTPPTTQFSREMSSPVEVHLSLAQAPLLNQPTDLTCTFWS